MPDSSTIIGIRPLVLELHDSVESITLSIASTVASSFTEHCSNHCNSASKSIKSGSSLSIANSSFWGPAFMSITFSSLESSFFSIFKSLFLQLSCQYYHLLAYCLVHRGRFCLLRSFHSTVRYC